MLSVIPPGDNVAIIGRTQKYLGLAVNFGMIYDQIQNNHVPELTSAWQPTAAELEALNKGASIIVSLLNITSHPPILLEVGELPETINSDQITNQSPNEHGNDT